MTLKDRMNAIYRDLGLDEIPWNLEEPPSAPVFAAMRCGDDCEGRVDVTDALAERPVGEWGTVRVSLRDLGGSGANLGHVTVPFMLATEGTLALRFAEVRLEPVAEGDEPCPG